MYTTKQYKNIKIRRREKEEGKKEIMILIITYPLITSIILSIYGKKVRK